MMLEKESQYRLDSEFRDLQAEMRMCEQKIENEKALIERYKEERIQREEFD